MSKAFEVGFDGLVGPTHNYSGLSHGNIASTNHRALESNPREAVLQGLEKAKKLADLGLKQALLPPQERPCLTTLRKLGFTGTDEAILARVACDEPAVLSAVSSASSMWTANAATVSPSADTADGRVHFTAANLVAKFHRSIEPDTTSRILRAIFKNPKHFAHHEPLPRAPQFGDEGAANHTRFCADYSARGIEFFVYGKQGLHHTDAHGHATAEPKKFPARQTLEASRAIARLHQLDPSCVVFAQQNPEAIDAGVFHNDVAGVGNQGVYFYHENSFSADNQVMEELSTKYLKTCGRDLTTIRVPAAAVSLQDAVKSYLFNSQLVSLPSGKMALILPEECKTNSAVAAYLSDTLPHHADVIQETLYFDLKQSMRNGGGPACLRLRVVLTEEELLAAHPGVFMNDQLFGTLTTWAKKHYRDRLALKDLGDPKLLMESRQALDELTTILGLGSIYPFQQP
jgi:succinylarginine dihydrolase